MTVHSILGGKRALLQAVNVGDEIWHMLDDGSIVTLPDPTPRTMHRYTHDGSTGRFETVQTGRREG